TDQKGRTRQVNAVRNKGIARHATESRRDQRKIPVAEHVALGPRIALLEPGQIPQAADNQTVSSVQTRRTEFLAEVVQVGGGGAEAERVAAKRLEARQGIASRELKAFVEAAIQTRK